MTDAICRELSEVPDNYPRHRLEYVFQQLREQEKEEFVEKVSGFVREFCKSPYYRGPHEKARLLYEVLSRSLTYDHGNDDLRFSYAGAVKSCKAVCMGIAEIFTMLGTLIGLKVKTFVGYAGDPQRKGGLHAWNLLWLPDNQGALQPYHLDLTWDLHEYVRQWGGYKFYLKSDSYMRREDHEWIADRCPVCSVDQPQALIPHIPGSEVKRLSNIFKNLYKEEKELIPLSGHFQPGDIVPFHDSRGTVLRIDRVLGSGSQADVYVALDILSKQYVAVKHLYGNYASNKPVFYEKTKRLASHRSPHPSLCWPRNVSVMTKNGSFLYTMDLLEGYHNLRDSIVGTAPLTDKEKAAILCSAAEILQSLHKEGFIYGDISHTNLMYKKLPDGTINVRFIDCENISLSGYSLGLEGSGKYRARDVLLKDSNGGHAALTCQTDIFSFGVLAFRMFLRRHPFDGKLARQVRADDRDGFLEHYGRHPIFIFDGDKNDPGPAVRAKFEALPKLLQMYFQDMFSQATLQGKQPYLDLSMAQRVLKRSFGL